MKIAIIGAGPRGILVTSQLINQYKNNTDQTNPLEISIFDPYEIGGRVWKKDQWEGLIMNTPADQITLFTDKSVRLTSPVYDGPSLFEWLKSNQANEYLIAKNYSKELVQIARNMRTNDYPPRVLFGAYIRWFYQQLLAELPYSIHLNYHQEEITALNIKDDQSIELSTDNEQYIFDKVAMGLGQQENYLNHSEQQLMMYAQENHLMYLPPITPGDADLSEIPAGENVIVRGLGLSFSDYISNLTLGRGGKYMTAEDGHLVYQPSGKEPHIIAGSKRGLPYYPKGISQKGYGERIQPAFLTPENIKNSLIDGKLPYDTFTKLLRLDIELMYYALLITDKYPNKNASEFRAEFIKATDHDKVLKAFGIHDQDYLVWDLILNPTIAFSHHDFTQYQTDLISWLDNVTQDAEMGSKTGPLSSALELLRDFRDIIRNLVNQKMFTNDEYYNEFMTHFNSDQNFLAVGAPALRAAQLSALMRAGIVTIMGPNLQVVGENSQFIASSQRFSDKIEKASYLLEARVPRADINTTKNPLLEHLVEAKLAKSATLTVKDETLPILAADVDHDTNQLITSDGKVLDNIYLWGLTIEGIRWSTTTSPRPGVDDPDLQTADFLAAKLLNLPAIQNPELQ